MKSHLQPYSGPLTLAKIIEGIEAAQGNALRLIEDARVLIDAQRFPSANALAILAMEERGKVHILKVLALVNDPADIKAAWKDYRSHRAKNAGWIIPDLVKRGARTMSGMAAAIDRNGEHTGLLDALKQISLYTDCLGDRHWSIPEEVIDEALARAMIGSAIVMWGAKAVSFREVELWREIVGPSYNQPTMMDAVLHWQAAMVKEGLSEQSVAGLQAFMRGQPVDT